MEDKNRVECIMHTKRDIYNKDDMYIIMSSEDQFNIRKRKHNHHNSFANHDEIDQSLEHFEKCGDACRLDDVQRIKEQ